MYDIRHPEIKLIGELAEDFVSVSQPFFNENGTIILVNEDDQMQTPAMVVYDINKFLADPKNTLATNDPE
jgi:hypothetical protein